MSKDKSKVLFILFLMIVLGLIVPFNQLKAQGSCGLTDVNCWIRSIFEWLAQKLPVLLANIIGHILKLIAHLIWELLSFIGLKLVAPIVDFISQLDPFQNTGDIPSPVALVWNILVNFSYIIMVFSALFAGFQWLFGEDLEAKNLIFNIILVAFLINFSFLLVEESFKIVNSLETGLTGGSSKKIGTLIAASMWSRNPYEDIHQIFISRLRTTNETDTRNNPWQEILAIMASVGAYWYMVIIAFIVLVILVMVGIFYLLRYIFIIILAGISPLAFTSLVLPKFKRGSLAQLTADFITWDKWLDLFLRWLLVIPIFVILVILGIAIKENAFRQLSERGLFGSEDFIARLLQFSFILYFLIIWFLMSVNFAVRFTGAIGNLARAFALAITTAGPALLASALGGLLLPSLLGRLGGILAKPTGSLAQKIGTGGPFQVRSKISNWLYDVSAKSQKWQEEALKPSLQAASQVLQNLLEEVPRASEQRRREIAVRINELYQKWRGTPVMKELNKKIKEIDVRSLEVLMSDEEAVKALRGLFGKEADLETRQVFAGRIKDFSRKTLKGILTNEKFIDAFSVLSEEVVSTLAKKLAEEFKGQAGIELMGDKEVGGKVIENLKKVRELRKEIFDAFNEAVSGLADDLIVGNTKAIGRTISTIPEEVVRSGALIRMMVNAGLKENEIGQALAFGASLNPNRIIPLYNQARHAPEIKRLIETYYSINKEDYRKEIEPVIRELSPQMRVHAARIGLIILPMETIP